MRNTAGSGWNRYAIRKYYTASGARMSTPTPQDVLEVGKIKARGGGDIICLHLPPRISVGGNADDGQDYTPLPRVLSSTLLKSV